MEVDKQKALQALKDIDSILNGVRNFFPKTSEERKESSNEVRLLKRASGIIVKFNEENAERKLKSLIAFIDSIKKDTPIYKKWNKLI